MRIKNGERFYGPALLSLGLLSLSCIAAGCAPTPDSAVSESAPSLAPEDYPDPAAATVPIAGVTVGVVGMGVILENHSIEDLGNVEIVINEGSAEGGFRFYVPRIGSNTTNTYLAQVFRTEAGEKLNPVATKVENFALYADTPRGRGYWRGAY